jgi:cytochrome c556
LYRAIGLLKKCTNLSKNNGKNNQGVVMNYLWIVSIALLTSMLGLAGASAQQADNDEGMRAFEYRTSVMRIFATQRRVLTEMAEGKRATDVTTFKNSANALAAVAKIIPEAFSKNATVKESGAKPEIWSDWNGFLSIANSFANTVGEIAKVAATDVEAAKKMVAGIKECGNCHEKYRN